MKFSQNCEIWSTLWNLVESKSIERMRVWWCLFGSLWKDQGAENLRKFQNSFVRWLHSLQLMKLGLHSQFWSIAKERYCYYYLWVPFGLFIIEHLQFLDCISVFAAKMFTLSFSSQHCALYFAAFHTRVALFWFLGDCIGNYDL